MLNRILLILICLPVLVESNAQSKKSFNNDWEFTKDMDTVFSERLLIKDNGIKWENIALPHTANLEPVEKTAQQWQGKISIKAYGKGIKEAILILNSK